MNQRILYFARPEHTHGTPLDVELITLLRQKWRGDTLVMNDKTAHKNATNLVVLPFPDGMWGADEWEAASAVLDLNAGRYVWVIDPATHIIRFLPKQRDELKLTPGQTCARVYFHDGSLRPYL